MPSPRCSHRFVLGRTGRASFSRKEASCELFAVEGLGFRVWGLGFRAKFWAFEGLQPNMLDEISIREDIVFATLNPASLRGILRPQPP